MAMYAIATVPLIHHLQHEVIQVWYADDAIAGGKLTNLRSWWDQLVQCGHEYGYHANANKTWLMVKEEHLTQAKTLFADSGVQITADGRRHLGATLGVRSFGNTCQQKSERLGSGSQNSGLNCFESATRCFCCFNTWSVWQVELYLQRIISDTLEVFQPLEDAIYQAPTSPSTNRQSWFN